jgi:SAM-dependent methyltransferase
MSDDITDIAAYYNASLEREHERLERHQLEWDLTWRYLEAYLPHPGAILEIGAATGRYTLELARRGYTVTAVDLSADLLAECTRRIAEAGLSERARCLAADARDLPAVAGRDYDAVLLMGPLYHLIDEGDRRRALVEAFHRLRAGGRFFSASISRFGVFGDLIKKDPAWIEDPGVISLVQQGKRPDDAPRGGFRGYFARVEEIAPLHESVGFETLALAAVEPCLGADDESYNRLEGAQRQRWLDLFYRVSAEPSILGASRHLLYVGRKPETSS